MYCAGKYVDVEYVDVEYGDVECGRESVDDENEVLMREYKYNGDD